MDDPEWEKECWGTSPLTSGELEAIGDDLQRRAIAVYRSLLESTSTAEWPGIVEAALRAAVEAETERCVRIIQTERADCVADIVDAIRRRV